MKEFKKGEPTKELVVFLDNMQKAGYMFLTKILVFTDKKQVLLVCEELECILPCEIGKNGFIDFLFSKEGDCMTPVLCQTKVRHIDFPENPNKSNAATFSKTLSDPVCLGPCFVCLYIIDPNTDKIRGIGFHGSENDTTGILEPTDGCIRLYNADLYLIRKLFFKNQSVIIL